MEDKKKYSKPEIIFESDLETKAGSPSPKPEGMDVIELFPEE